MNNSETNRLSELYNLNILNTDKEARFDRFTALIANIFNTPIALISLIDTNRLWFKSCVGISIETTARSTSFCEYAIQEKEILVIPDATQDERFANNASVLYEPNIRFYAGAILHGPSGQPIGTVCIIDRLPREFLETQQQQLIQFAHLIEHELSFTYHIDEIRKKIESALYYDAQSGIPNRRLLKERLEQLLKTNPEKPAAILALKINQMNKLENSFGIDVPELIITEAHKRLLSVLSKSAIVSHWEDDLFVILVNINSPEKELFNKIKRILEVFEPPFIFHQEKQKIFCNIDVSIYPDDAKEPIQLINNAIYTMRLESTESRTSYRFYSDDSTKRLAKNYELERALIKALDNDALELYYQPKIDIKTGKICGAEALCRWQDETHGIVSPVVFIPLAEEADLIIPLGNWVLRHACQQNQQWQTHGSLKFPISVNISKKQLQHEKFTKLIIDILQETQLPANYLDLEITESTLIKLEEVTATLKAISELGVSFSLDDFGTGFSSLGYLQKLPLKTLKIDKSFIDNIVTNSKDALMVRTIISISKSLNLNCVAEGVETAEQLFILQKLECDQIQGYLFSKPLPAIEFKKLLDENKTFTTITNSPTK